MKTQKVNVTEDKEYPIERNILANAIVAISSAMRQLQRGGLTREAVVILTQHNCKSPWKNATKPSISEVRAVMDSLDDLASRFTTK